jgi:hypothetical protein
MKKFLLPLAVILLVALASPVFADWELGMSWTPLPTADVNAQGNTTKLDSITGFHVAYAWFILFGSWDALAIPNFMVEGMTSYYDTETQIYYPGSYVPGFVNLFDAGVRLVIAPFVAFAEVGTNTLYIYKAGMAGGIGANLRLGAGLYFDWWGVTVSGTSLFASFADLQRTLKALGDQGSRNQAINSIEKSLIPSIQLTLYLK